MGEQSRVALVVTSWCSGFRSRLRRVSGRFRSDSRVCSAPPLEGAVYHDGCGNAPPFVDRLVVYADDFVILCRSNAEEAKKQMLVPR